MAKLMRLLKLLLFKLMPIWLLLCNSIKVLGSEDPIVAYWKKVFKGRLSSIKSVRMSGLIAKMHRVTFGTYLMLHLNVMGLNH